MRFRFGDPPFREDEWRPFSTPPAPALPATHEARDAEALGERAQPEEVPELADAEPNVGWVLADTWRHARGALVRLSRFALNNNSHAVLARLGSAHWVAAYSEHARSVHVTQRLVNLHCSATLDEAFEVPAPVAFVVLALHGADQRALATATLTLGGGDALQTRWCCLRTNAHHVPISTANFAKFARVSGDAAFGTVDRAQWLSDGAPNCYTSVLSTPPPSTATEWRHWRLCTLAVLLLGLLMTLFVSP